MSTVTGFPPIAHPSARVLILGSMPGVLSLNANEYYAHPRNAFWRILSRIYGFDAEAAYEHRVESLKASGVAVWDVLHTCVRAGSLDSAIEKGSRIPNDFVTFFQRYRLIDDIIFNGAEAEKSFSTYVLPHLNVRDMGLTRLPSTSPANTLAFEKKLSAWQAVLGA
jgi:hypoxanthine-DNA glycosylase